MHNKIINNQLPTIGLNDYKFGCCYYNIELFIKSADIKSLE